MSLEVERFRDALALETLRTLERGTVLDDGAAFAQACAADVPREQRLLLRARTLWAELELERELDQLRALLLVLAALAALAIAYLSGSVIHSMFGGDRKLNVFLSLTVALLPSLLGLAVWLLAVAANRPGEARVLQLLLRLLPRRALSTRSLQVLTAATSVLDRQRLSAWAWGALMHAVWVAVYLALLGYMAVVFLFREYQLDWETTILAPGTLERMLRAVAALPSALGLPALDDAAFSADPVLRNKALAWWLIGATLTYGLLLRLLALAGCGAMWRLRSARFTVDLADPYYRRLLNRFDAAAPAQVVDAEHARTPRPADDVAWDGRPGTACTIAFELPPELAPPAALRQAAQHALAVDGSAAERREALRLMQALRPERLVVLCHAASTPDRGTARFIAEAGAPARRAALLLLPAAGAPRYGPRWRQWLDATNLQDFELFTREDDAVQWLERGRG